MLMCLHLLVHLAIIISKLCRGLNIWFISMNILLLTTCLCKVVAANDQFLCASVTKLGYVSVQSLCFDFSSKSEGCDSTDKSHRHSPT